MPFCPHCGNPVDEIPGAAAPAEEREPVEVTLARIEKDRAVEVARIEAGAQRAELRSAEAIAETQADAEVDAAQAVAEIVTAGDSEPEPEPGPVEIVAPDVTEDEEVTDDAPPAADDVTTPHAPGKPRGLGLWG